MRSTNLPQMVAVRLLDLDERVTALVAEANKADAAVEYSRAIINSKIDEGPKVFEETRAGFSTVYAQAQAARARADTERGILNGIRTWIANLPHNTKLCSVPPPADGDLATLQAKLANMRAELQKLNSITIPAADVGAKVQAYVHELAAQAQPMLRGLGAGQQLEILWPGGPDCNRRNGNGFSTIDGNALYLAALLQPDALQDAILRTVQATQPMPKLELENRRAELPAEIDELSYAVAALLEKAGSPPDPAMSPWHWLGVRTKDEEAQHKIAV